MKVVNIAGALPPLLTPEFPVPGILMSRYHDALLLLISVPVRDGLLTDRGIACCGRFLADLCRDQQLRGLATQEIV